MLESCAWPRCAWRLRHATARSDGGGAGVEGAGDDDDDDGADGAGGVGDFGFGCVTVMGVGRVQRVKSTVCDA